MKKYLLCEWKRSFSSLLVLTVAWTIFCVAHFSTIELEYVVRDWKTGAIKEILPSNPQLWVYFVPLYILCMLTPVFTYSFQMDKRSVDYYFAFPLKREKLYFVKTLVGLSTVLIPFTVAFWSGFLAAVFRDGNLWQMVGFGPTYFIGVLFAICIYGIYAFVFTRANKVRDGVAFMIAYTFVFNLVLSFYDVSILTGVFGEIPFYIQEIFLFFGLNTFATYATEWIRGVEYSICHAETFIVPILLGAIAYGLLFFTLRYQKAENAEQISNSPFGYTALIPIYTAFMVALNGAHLLMTLFCFIGAVIATAWYRRKFKFTWKDWAMLGVATVLGLLLRLLL